MSNLTQFINYYRYIPMNIKKVNNYAQNLYYYLSSKNFAKNGNTLISGQDGSDIMEELNLLRERIQERFRKTAKAFKFFDLSSKGMIQPKEFELGTIKLGFSFNQILIQKIFDYIDFDQDGRIQYTEFSKFWEEEKQDFKSYSANKFVKRSESERRRSNSNGNNIFNRSFTIKSSPIDDFISESIANYKLKKRK